MEPRNGFKRSKLVNPLKEKSWNDHILLNEPARYSSGFLKDELSGFIQNPSLAQIKPRNRKALQLSNSRQKRHPRLPEKFILISAFSQPGSSN